MSDGMSFDPVNSRIDHERRASGLRLAAIVPPPELDGKLGMTNSMPVGSNSRALLSATGQVAVRFHRRNPAPKVLAPASQFGWSA
jgi:hypothetical protein